jgi:hypothetical protein
LAQTNSSVIVGSTNKICSDNNSCVGYQFINDQGDSMKFRERLGFLGFREAMITRNDTLFYSDNSFGIDSFFYWHFGLVDLSGNIIKEYKFKILHLNDVGIGSFGYIRPINYGLTLVKNNEVILWGEGLDKRMPNPTKVPYRSAFLRLGLDGTRKSDVIWYELNDNPQRRMADAAEDIDGNLVFSYENKHNENDKYFRNVIKLKEDNSFQILGTVLTDHVSVDFPKKAVDNESNYFY